LKSDSNLEKVLRAGYFAVTGELGPPRGAGAGAIREKAAHLVGVVDAANITDNQTAVVRMSSWGASILAVASGLEPVYQMVCRDRNRLAMQSDVLGAAANGVKNILCLSGDHQSFGDHPEAKGVFDLDSIQLIRTVSAMRDERKFLSGEEIEEPPRMFIGAAANPFADPFEWRVKRLAAKVAAGADFIQTQCIFNMKKFREFMARARDLGVTEKTFILAGVTPLKSAAMAAYMRDKVPGMDVPDAVVERMNGAPKKTAAAEGIKIACETIAELREINGVAGVHLMAIGWEHRVPEIANLAGLLPRPAV
jgi:methylenetetrahydrofolate reductase (NADPH)